MNKIKTDPYLSHLNIRTINKWCFTQLNKNTFPIIIIIVIIGFGIREPKMLAYSNIINILNQTSYLLILAIAQMIVLLTRGFDLSIGNTVSMIGVVTSVATVKMVGIYPESNIFIPCITSCLVGLFAGVFVGAINGFNVAFLKINPFVATMGMMSIGYGIASTATGGYAVILPEVLVNVFGRGKILGINITIILCLFVCISIHFILTKTTLGRSFYLIGDNPKSAHVAGISVKLHTMMAYIICSLLASIVAVLMISRTGTGEPNLGGGLMMKSIMAAIIGGVSFRGGKGNVWNCVIGALFVTILSNGMNLNRFSGYIQEITLGFITIAAVVVYGLQRHD